MGDTTERSGYSRILIVNDDSDDDEDNRGTRILFYPRAWRDNPFSSISNSNVTSNCDLENPTPSTSRATENILPSTSRRENLAEAAASRQVAEDLQLHEQSVIISNLQSLRKGYGLSQIPFEEVVDDPGSVGNSILSGDSNDDSPKKRKHCEEFEGKYPLTEKDPVRKFSKLDDITQSDLLPIGNFSKSMRITQSMENKHTCRREQNALIPHSHDNEARVENACYAVLNCPDYMEHIFKWLNLPEKNNFRLVCERWYEMAHSFSFKSVYVCEKKLQNPEFPRIDDLARIVTDIKERPLLKKIVIGFRRLDYHSTIVDTVLKHTEDLHHLELRYITPNVLADIVKKYPNLKSFAFERGSVDILKCMDLIKDYSNLERLEFTSSGDHEYNEQYYASVCETIADNFPNLQHLALVPVKNAATVKSVTSLLSKKFENLLSLKLECYKSDNVMYSLVNKCTNLKKVDLKLHSPTLPFELCNLSQLIDLKLAFDGNYTNEIVMRTITSFLTEKHKNLEHLRFELLNEKLDLIVFERLCENFKFLKTLYLWNVDTNTLDGQLKSIRGLKKLTDLTVFGATITRYGSQYIGMCESLKSLTLMKCQIIEPALNQLAESNSLEVIKVVSTPIRKKVILRFIPLTRNLKKINFTGCNLINAQKLEIYYKLNNDLENRHCILILA